MVVSTSLAGQAWRRCQCQSTNVWQRLGEAGHPKRAHQQPMRNRLRCHSYGEDQEPFDREFQASLATELGVKAIYEEDLDEEEDWDDIMEETEDPWMREPAGLYFAGERIEVPDLLKDDSQPSDLASGAGGAPAAAAAAAGSALPGASAAGAAADAGSAGTTASGGTRPAQGAYGASVPRVSLGDALTHVEDGSGVLLAVDDRGTAVHPACVVIPLADLDAAAAAPLMQRRAFVVPTGPGGAMHALQACIRLQSVHGHPDVALVDTGDT